MSGTAASILYATEIVTSLLASALTIQRIINQASAEGRDLTDDEITVIREARKTEIARWRGLDG